MKGWRAGRVRLVLGFALGVLVTYAVLAESVWQAYQEIEEQAQANTSPTWETIYKMNTPTPETASRRQGVAPEFPWLTN